MPRRGVRDARIAPPRCSRSKPGLLAIPRRAVTAAPAGASRRRPVAASHCRTPTIGPSAPDGRSPLPPCCDLRDFATGARIRGRGFAAPTALALHPHDTTSPAVHVRVRDPRSGASAARRGADRSPDGNGAAGARRGVRLRWRAGRPGAGLQGLAAARGAARCAGGARRAHGAARAGEGTASRRVPTSGPAELRNLG